MSGEPIQLLCPTADHKFDLKDDVISKLLMQDDIKDRFVCVVSVAGAFRTGKSFLLGFFLRYLDAMYVRHDVGNWLGDEEKTLEGFVWKSSSDRVTTGILMWSNIFLHDYPNGDKVAIILLDTQGTFDSQSTVKDCATVFALSTMLSSVQIYNLSRNIQEDSLQHLQLYTEYGRLALNDSDSETPFQHLVFLVRDWSCAHEFEYGGIGGKELLKKRLEVTEKQHPQLKSLRANIKSCFSEISCFLMPHPGKDVDTNPHCHGLLRDMEPDFKDYLSLLVPMLLSPENLVCKKIFGKRVRASELLDNFKLVVSIFQDGSLPEPDSIYMTMAKFHRQKFVEDCMRIYIEKMNQTLQQSSALSPEVLNTKHSSATNSAVEEYDSQTPIGGEELISKYRDQLKNEIKQKFTFYEEINSRNLCKNIVKACLQIYAEKMDQSICGLSALSSKDLNTKHSSAQKSAMDEYDSQKAIGGNELITEYRNQLDDEIKQKFTFYENKNKIKKNWLDIVEECLQIYTEQMNIMVRGPFALSSEDLNTKHSSAKNSAMDKYYSQQIIDGENLFLEYRDQLNNKIMEKFMFYDKQNKNKEENQDHLQNITEVCLQTYTEKMDQKLYGSSAISPKVLVSHHLSAKKSAMEKYNSEKIIGGEKLISKYRNQLTNEIKQEFTSYENENKIKKKCLDIVEECLQIYTDQMNMHVVSKQFALCFQNLNSVHSSAKKSAMDGYYSQQIIDGENLFLEYRDQLNNKIMEKFKFYENQNKIKEFYQNITQSCLQIYTANMDSKSSLLSIEDLETVHSDAMNLAMQEYNNQTINVGTENDVTSKYFNQLKCEILEKFKCYKNRNNNEPKDMEECIAHYDAQMKRFVSSGPVSDEVLNEKHISAFDCAVSSFNKQYSNAFLIQFQNECDKLCELYRTKRQNQDHWQDIVKHCLEMYMYEMNSRPYAQSFEQLDSKHLSAQMSAMEKFDSTQDKGGAELIFKCRNQLENEIKEKFSSYEKRYSCTIKLQKSCMQIYIEKMDQLFNGSALSTNELNDEHSNAKKSALNAVKNLKSQIQREFPIGLDNEIQNQYYHGLLEETIQEKFTFYEEKLQKELKRNEEKLKRDNSYSNEPSFLQKLGNGILHSFFRK